MSSRNSRSASSPAALPRSRPCRKLRSGSLPRPPSPSSSWPTIRPRCSPRAKRKRLRSLCGAAWRPPIGERIVRLFGVDPNLATRPPATGKLDLFPERRARFEIIHQEFGGRESILTVSGSGDDEDDLFAGLEPAIAVDYGDAEQRPTPFGRFDVTHNLGLGHSRIVLERHGRERGARLILAAYTGKCDHSADIAGVGKGSGRLAPGIEGLTLQSDSGGHLHSGMSGASRRSAAWTERQPTASQPATQASHW